MTIAVDLGPKETKKTNKKKQTNSLDSDEMQHYGAFHLGIHCLQKYLFRGFPEYKGLEKSCSWYGYKSAVGCGIWVYWAEQGSSAQSQMNKIEQTSERDIKDGCTN